MNNRFTPVPAVPQTNLDGSTAMLISSVKENVELLTGFRGEADVISKAITQGQITVLEVGQQSMRQVSAEGKGTEFTVSGTTHGPFPLLSDYSKLLSDVQKLADDVSQTRAYLNFLIKQLKGNKA